MKKRNVVIALAVTAALTVPFSVFAATSDTTTAKSIRGFFGIDTSS
jgi:curli biogenesis system outer membrane secretion channel CsgG